MLPGVGSALKDVEVDESQLDRLEGIVHSMTAQERDNIKILTKSRIKRIAKGSGTTQGDVNKLTKQFEMVQKMTKQMGMGGKLKAIKELRNAGPSMLPGVGNVPGMRGKGSTKTVSVKTKYKQRKKRK